MAAASDDKTSVTVFSDSVERALIAAVAAHEGQVRKGPERRPYFVHPLQLALLLARLGEPDEVLVAALLHDVVEDSDAWTLERVASEFGVEAAGVVGELSEDKSLSWADRKRLAVEHAPALSEAARTVKAADLLHNLYSLCTNLAAASDPDLVWTAFRGGRDDTLRMQRRLADALLPRLSPDLRDRLRSAIDELERVAGPTTTS